MIKVFIILTLVFLGGCANGVIKDNQQRPENGQAIVLLAVKPDFLKINLVEGDLSGNSFLQNGGYKNSGFPINGYVAFKVKSGVYYGIGSYQVKGDKTYWICNGNNTPVFKAPNKGVIYIGDLNFSFVSNGKTATEIAISKNFDDAFAYLNTQYPNLHGALIDFPYVLASASKSCPQNYNYSTEYYQYKYKVKKIK